MGTLRRAIIRSKCILSRCAISVIALALLTLLTLSTRLLAGEDCLSAQRSLRAWLSGDEQGLNRITGLDFLGQRDVAIVPGIVGDCFRFTKTSRGAFHPQQGWRPSANYSIECWVRRLPPDQGGTRDPAHCSPPLPLPVPANLPFISSYRRKASLSMYIIASGNFRVVR